MGLTVSHHCIWHTQVENTFQLLCDNNTGNLLDGCTFGEVFKYFLLGGNNKCFIDSYVHMYVIGYKEKRKFPLIRPLFVYIYHIPQDWLLVLNPLCSLL